tara:strand:+ start:331 stop:543 length:213 start_codon:yes stop_codon:yes gene_type:complete
MPDKIKTLDISMNWEQGMRSLALVCMNCKSGSEQEMLDHATSMGKQMDDICAAYEDLVDESDPQRGEQNA